MGLNTKQKLVFAFIIIVLSIHFRFFETIHLPPQSTDLWRQADCFSIALNYYQNGFHFFKPQVHFLFSQNGYAAGEFPLIYFISAILFKIFGVHYFLFKGLNLLIFFAGMLALYKILLKYTSDLFLAGFFSVFYFCTPVVFFYANNFLSDVSALSFNIIGLYFFICFTERKTMPLVVYSAVCFALAGLLKASASIFLIAMICALFSQYFIKFNHSVSTSVSPKERFHLLLSYTLSLSSIVSWYAYAISFNQSNKTVFFGTKAMKGWPLWENNVSQITSTLNIFKLIHAEILSPFNIFLFLVCIASILIFWKKTDSFFIRVWLFLLIGLAMFISYFWRGFEDQQYYLVNLIILPILSAVLAVRVFISFDFSSKIKLCTYGVLFIGMLWMIYSSKNVYKCYYKAGWRVQKLAPVYYEKNISATLLKYGINQDDRIISINDGTPNGTLSMLNRSGWSGYGFGANKQYNVNDFEAKIKMGAKFLIINDTALLKNECVKKFLQQPLGNYKQLYLYKLPQLQ
jgi:hypothetical protein